MHRQSYLVSSSEEREFGLKESIDFTQCQFLAWHRLDGHHDQGDVTVGWLFLSSGT
jgi:hypothetical protein